MKTIRISFIVLLLLFINNLQLKAQIGDILDLAGGAGDVFSGCSGSDVGAACTAMDCCWNGGFLFIDFMINHHQEIMELRFDDPTLLSFDVNAQFAHGFHYAHDTLYNYINYLPQLRANLGVFSLDYRYNILTEYAGDSLVSFKSWSLLLLVNMVADKNFKISFGSGVYYEMFTENYYNEHYLGGRIGVFDNRNFIDIDSRLVVDYSTSKLPFFEAGIRYNAKIINFEHLYCYISIGGMYQNYYSAHDIWAIRGGLSINIH